MMNSTYFIYGASFGRNEIASYILPFETSTSLELRFRNLWHSSGCHLWQTYPRVLANQIQTNPIISKLCLKIEDAGGNAYGTIQHLRCYLVEGKGPIIIRIVVTEKLMPQIVFDMSKFFKTAEPLLKIVDVTSGTTVMREIWSLFCKLRKN